jgi:hypothetical protein
MQHYKYIKHFHKNKEVFEICKKRDEIKKKYCEDNNIVLITISYKNFNKIDEILTKELQLA